MKHVKVLSFAIIVVFSACNEKAADEGKTTAITASAATLDSDNRAEMMKANSEVQRAIETGDTVTLRKYISADAIDHGGGENGADAKGEEIVRMLANVHNDIDNLKFETLEESANDDHVFALVRMTGTTNKPVWGMPANFKVDSKSIDLVRLKDNKMIEHWTFLEPAEMMKMMNPGGGSKK
ncbi:MAG: SnoaL-like polyketide cyclase [Segetibacter sp.]|nr:SnoaL-like polyketide cyclase [Segetibacter sp.]